MTREVFKQKNGIIGKSQELNDLVDVVIQVAPSDITVLIYGESGVGKEIFARAIHNASKRADKPLITVNCGAIPEGILESELFGHKKGSFTGAIDHRKGYFEMADGGTLFLDEIAEMPLTTQVKVLRAIEGKEFMRIGSETVTNVDVRFIAATNKDLQNEVDIKHFREDLYFRLKVVTFNIPPLRKRKGDIEQLADYFIQNYAKDNRKILPVLTNEALHILMEYNWPGNIRELKNTIETAIALSKDEMLGADSFTSLLVKEKTYEDHRNLPVFLRKTPEEADRELLYRALFEIKKDLIELKDIILHQQKEVITNNNYDNEVLPLDEMEKGAIKNALDQTRGSKRKAARLLNISERTLYRKIKEYQLQ
ncbi:MAG: sigma-54-dependent Fis family transcriptional regulator [Bacteroidetes bacterium]|nr:sigma-54-dependent Fis family transcriptional regulator [Bacteroidota bacterium]